MARRKTTTQQGMSPAAKVAVLLAVLGVPVLFFASSYGLSLLFDVAPFVVLVIAAVLCTTYTAYTAGLLYQYYEVPAPFTRFVPCICEVSLIDRKFHLPCYILYVLAVVFGGLSQLPFAAWNVLGETVAFNAPFYCMVVALAMLLLIQIIKGIGLMGCIKDIAAEWDEQVHTDAGALTKLAFLSFIPFVRIIALYSVNKPLSTMVSFMGVVADDAGDDEEDFAEEE